jgi:hypothetical protein
MKHTAIFATSVALLSFSSLAADTPSDSKTPSLSVVTNAPAVTNAPHLHPTFTERLHQIQKRDATNRVPDRASQQALIEQQMQQMQRQHDEALKRAGTPMPPLQPPESGASLPRYKKPGT